MKYLQKNKAKLPRSPFPYQMAFVLVNPLRKLFTNRERVIRDAAITNSSIVLEIGCGPGFFTETISKIVGKEGKVYAQDVQKEMLEKLEKRLSHLPTKDNISLILSSSSHIDLPDHSLDVIFAVNVFEEIEKEGETYETIKEIGRLLKKEGSLLFIEHKFGKTAPAINRVVDTLLKEEFELIDKKEGFISYQAKFIK